MGMFGRLADEIQQHGGDDIQGSHMLLINN